MRKPLEKWNPMELACCIGVDALRLAIGSKPKNFTPEEIIRWLVIMAGERRNAKGM